MKRNAIIRIILWSTVLVLLVGILGSVVAADTYRVHRLSKKQEAVTHLTSTAPTIADDIGTPFETPGYILEDVNVRAAPNKDSDAIASLHPGDMVDIKRYEQADGEKWLYIQAPVRGWILGKYVDLAPAGAVYTEPEMDIEDKKEASPITETIREIEIEWVAGSITIEPADVERITVKETMASDPAYTMVCRTGQNKLSIRFCEENQFKWGFGSVFGEELSKNLIIRVPKNYQLDSLEVDAASANMTVKNMAIREVEFSGASGVANFENCVVDEMDIDTASGDVTFTGTMKKLDCDAASASVRAVLDNEPTHIDMDSMSGDLDLTLPDYAGFTVRMDAASSDFYSDFDTTVRNDNYVCGDGSCRINMDAMSGDVYIRKATAAAATPVNP